MLLNLRDLGEIRADEMREVKPIILMGIVHDLQETFVPGRRATIKDSELSVFGCQASVKTNRRSRHDAPLQRARERSPPTSKATMCSRINRLANGRQERAIKDWVGEWTGSENRRLEIADSKVMRKVR